MTGGEGVKRREAASSSEGLSFLGREEARKVCINCTGSVVGNTSKIRCTYLIVETTTPLAHALVRDRHTVCAWSVRINVKTRSY